MVLLVSYADPSSRLLALYKEAFEGLSKVDFAFIKFHATLHYSGFIRRYGSVVSTAGYPWEGAIRHYLRSPYRVVSKQRRGLELRIKRRVVLTSTLSLVSALYEDPSIQENLPYTVDTLWPREATDDPVPSGGPGHRLRRRSEIGGMTGATWLAAAGAMADKEVWFEAGGSTFAITGLPRAAQQKVGSLSTDLLPLCGKCLD